MALSLSPEQIDAVERITSHPIGSRLTFVTGRAGTGKSTLLRALMATFPGKAVVLAPTGLAAVNAGGQTIHSFFNLPIGPLDPATSEIPVFRAGSPKSNLVRSLDAIFIDEISMVRADLLDAIDESLRRNRASRLPFGGIPIISFGDVWQLEPVVAGPAEQEFLGHHYDGPFFFHSRVAKELGLDIIELHTVHRQATDPEFLYILDQLRRGNFENLDLLNNQVGPKVDAKALTLTVTNARARETNLRHLAQLPGSDRKYKAKVEGQFGRELPADEILCLKAGARVMFLKNSTEWVNGTLGTVREFNGTGVKVQLDSGTTVQVGPETWERNRYSWDRDKRQIVSEPVGSFVQLPLRLAWAITIHKSQGLTFDSVHIDLDRPAFGHGQVYVALSRCRTRPGISLSRPILQREIICHPSVVEFADRAGLSG